MDDLKVHWEKVYLSKASDELSWTQNSPSPSIEWIVAALPHRDSHIIDVGGGTSLLVDALLREGYSKPVVLDLSSTALMQSRERLGDMQSEVEWIEGNVVSYQSSRKFALWHDRAVFHFLTNSSDRVEYVHTLRRVLESKGKVILGTFSPTGPAQCSGLDVMRFDEEGLSRELGSDFILQKSEQITHQTPWGDLQNFLFCQFEKRE